MNYGAIVTSAWVNIQGVPDMEYTVYTDSVEFTIGGRNGFQFDAGEGGLAKLVETCTEALRALRAGELTDDSR
ncbi:MAG: hypothetical protein ABW215_04490 [Kibdelosporangium sp.]